MREPIGHSHSLGRLAGPSALSPQRGSGYLPLGCPHREGNPPLRAWPRHISTFKSQLWDPSLSRQRARAPPPWWPLRCPATPAEGFARAPSCSWVVSKDMDRPEASYRPFRLQAWRTAAQGKQPTTETPQFLQLQKGCDHLKVQFKGLQKRAI